ncbi:hypothetical protein KUTeg_001817 [Tegillarca granosa]|uniref:Cilia-and flagella-associated protein 74 n=1 Tax=Tegillarca granosa TaxID=220873 RepID=A0ABQ9FVB5_TEGGR|nr:hypothetical protein KUTeg_001817 [Tegillarca granosa]
MLTVLFICREFKIQCKGIGVHPPLELSKQVVHFSATALYDVSTTAIHVVNSHTSTNEFTHPVPRIGKGEIAPVTPTSFEFIVPENAPLTLSPSVGTIEPGKQKAGGKGAKSSGKDKPGTKTPAKGKASPAAAAGGGGNPATIMTYIFLYFSSAAYTQAIGSLLRQCKGSFRTYIIPCYVASGTCGNPGELPYSVYNTLYLEVHCPIVKPELVVISDNGNTKLDFGDISLGQNIIKSITIQNISKKTVEVSYYIFQEVLAIKTWTSALHITLAGKGVSPLVNLSPTLDNGMFDMGAVLASEYLERTFKQIPEFVARDKKSKSLVGTQNNNGQNVFDLVPADGTIPPGGSTEITVTFAPDHPSDHYSDGIKIELFGKEESHSFQIKGTAKPRIMYIEGFDERSPNVESLAEKPSLHTEDEDTKALPEPILFTLQSIAKESEFIPASRELHVGCVRTMAVSQKKNGEFQFENVQSITQKGFNIEPQKGMVEAGAIKPVTITWSPPPGHDPNQPVDASILLTLRGDTVDQFKIMLRAIVVSD